MKQITLRNVAEAEIGTQTYCHEVRMTRQVISEEEVTISVISASKELDGDDEDQLWEQADRFMWDEENSDEEPGDVEILSTNPGPVAGRCPNTPDMFAGQRAS